MVERKSVYSDPEAFNPDKVFPDGYGQMVGLVTGDTFTRNIYIENLSQSNTLELHTERQVVVAVMTDSDGNLYCEPYDPEMHGEEYELRTISIEEFTNNPDFFDAQESFTQTRKAGSSKPRFNMDDVWRGRGGDPSFKLPKEVYQKGKLR